MERLKIYLKRVDGISSDEEKFKIALEIFGNRENFPASRELFFIYDYENKIKNLSNYCEFAVFSMLVPTFIGSLVLFDNIILKILYSVAFFGYSIFWLIVIFFLFIFDGCSSFKELLILNNSYKKSYYRTYIYSNCFCFFSPFVLLYFSFKERFCSDVIERQFYINNFSVVWFTAVVATLIVTLIFTKHRINLVKKQDWVGYLNDKRK